MLLESMFPWWWNSCHWFPDKCKYYPAASFLGPVRRCRHTGAFVCCMCSVDIVFNAITVVAYALIVWLQGLAESPDSWIMHAECWCRPFLEGRDLFHLISSQCREGLTVPEVFISIREAAFSSCLPLPRCSAQIQADGDGSVLAIKTRASSRRVDSQWPLGSLRERRYFDVLCTVAEGQCGS